jgi:hypothetical protein
MEKMKSPSLTNQRLLWQVAKRNVRTFKAFQFLPVNHFQCYFLLWGTVFQAFSERIALPMEMRLLYKNSIVPFVCGMPPISA